MAFVKLDCGILNSTLWVDRLAREVFITALLMAEPLELIDPAPQMAVDTMENTGWTVPPGWYGFVPSAGIGIITRAMVDEGAGRLALQRLGAPEAESRSKAYEGRRLVRIDGGYLVLNYIAYRERDYTSAARSKRWRKREADRRSDTTQRRDDTVERRGETPDRRSATDERRDITQAEVEVDTKQTKTCAFDDFWAAYPKKKAKDAALKAWNKRKPSAELVERILKAIARQKTWPEWTKQGGQFVPYPATWLNAGGWDDEPATDGSPTLPRIEDLMAKMRASDAS